MIEVVADATVVVKLEHLRRPEVSASATLLCTKNWGGVGTGGGEGYIYRGRKNGKMIHVIEEEKIIIKKSSLV